MAILPAKGDIKKDTEILTRYWHKETALEIIIDLPLGFPINNIISL